MPDVGNKLNEKKRARVDSILWLNEEEKMRATRKHPWKKRGEFTIREAVEGQENRKRIIRFGVKSWIKAGGIGIQVLGQNYLKILSKSKIRSWAIEKSWLMWKWCIG